MAVLARTWIAAARARRKLGRRLAPREELIRRYASGRSFADIGCMWGVDGAIALLAEDVGASPVTAVDIMAPTPVFDAERARRSSKVRFVHGDLHDPRVIEAVGLHDVVWCSGVLYHSPDPLLTLRQLRAITVELLILATETIPEVPGLSQACVFLPGLSASDRAAHAAARPGIRAAGLSEPFDPSLEYGSWWWGISRSAVHGMLSATGFQVCEERGDALHATIVARPAPAPLVTSVLADR